MCRNASDRNRDCEPRRRRVISTHRHQEPDHVTLEESAAALSRLSMTPDGGRAGAADGGNGRDRTGTIEEIGRPNGTDASGAGDRQKPLAGQGVEGNRGRLGTTDQAEREGFEATLDGLASRRSCADLSLYRLESQCFWPEPHFACIVLAVGLNRRCCPQFVPTAMHSCLCSSPCFR